jgi:histone-lysine N-methyltransferase SETMAR
LWTTFSIDRRPTRRASSFGRLFQSALTVWEVAEECDISLGSFHNILTEKLGMHRVAAKFVPCLLTDEQKEQRVTISQELLDQANSDENFLKNIVMGDETWVYGYDVETKAQSSQWVKVTRPTSF